MAPMVCVWLPNWSLQRLEHERPALRERPVVLHAAGKRGPQVTACSRAARGCGVRLEMPLAEARALLAGCVTAEVHCEPQDRGADLQGLRELARTCEIFSPLFGIEEPPTETQPPESLLLDVAGCAHLFGGEQSLVDSIARDFRHRGFDVRVAAAATIGGAWAAAHFLATPDSQPVLAEADLLRTLSPLPLQALRLPGSLVRTLHELGVTTLGQLRELPRASLPSRFGPVLLRRLNQAEGTAVELLVPERPQQPLVATWTADEPLSDRQALRCVCQDLLEELLARLKPRREGVRQLRCEFQGGDRSLWELCVNLIRPHDAAPHFLDLLSLQIERACLPEEIACVRLEARGVASLAAKQRDLFGCESEEEAERDVSSLLDRLSSRLGPGAVVQAALVPEAQPELAVAYEPCLIALAESSRASAVGLESQTLLRHRPFRLWSSPQKIQADFVGPDGAPQHFYWQGREYRVVGHWGPERIETGWWRDEPIRRDYFRVEVETGEHYWLFRCREQLAWFLQGAFD